MGGKQKRIAIRDLNGSVLGRSVVPQLLPNAVILARRKVRQHRLFVLAPVFMELAHPIMRVIVPRNNRIEDAPVVWRVKRYDFNAASGHQGAPFHEPVSASGPRSGRHESSTRLYSASTVRGICAPVMIIAPASSRSSLPL